VLVSNHPQLAGGSHLPDITVITPVWEAGRVVFFVASRGHHAGAGWGWQGRVNATRAGLQSSSLMQRLALSPNSIAFHLLFSLPTSCLLHPTNPLLSCRHRRHLPRQHAPPFA